MVSRNTELVWDNQGNFSANLLHFGRLLRRLDIPVSSQQIFNLAEGVMNIDIARRDDFYHTARAFLLHDIDKLDQFDQAFDLFWSKHIKMLLEFSDASGKREGSGDELNDENEAQENIRNRRVAESHPLKEHIQASDSPAMQINPIYSPFEVLYRKDFSELNLDELRQAKDLIKKMVWDLNQKRTRRKIRAIKQTSNLDFRRSLRNNLNYGGEIIQLAWRSRKLKPRPLVVISDISGSMERYSLIFLYFLYALVQRSRRIEAFVFGTRLTRITPALRNMDVESVLADLSNTILDWSGGTRIGESIKEFNFQWSRRVLVGGAIVIIISDGWDRGDLELLETEIGRLRRSVNRMIWLNPLAGSPDYQPLVKGMQTVLPYVDDFYPLNNLSSLESVALKLSGLDYSLRIS
jgi:uncharacterized protein with von Willebrand factor type A (vWA) domain